MGGKPLSADFKSFPHLRPATRSQAFFERLDFKVEDGSPSTTEWMAYGLGGQIHLNSAVKGWLIPGQNLFGLYLCREDVDDLGAAFRGEHIGHLSLTKIS